MPCDSIILNQVNLKLANFDLLKVGLGKLGVQNIRESGGTLTFNYGGAFYTLGAGKLTGRNVSEREVGRVADLIKQNYSIASVEYAADRYGWLKQDGDDPTTFTLVKS